jgi:hypothetical protein
MSWASDKRFSPSRFEGAPEPLEYAKARGDGGLAVRKAAFEEGERRYQYKHPVKVLREPTARE